MIKNDSNDDAHVDDDVANKVKYTQTTHPRSHAVHPRFPFSLFFVLASPTVVKAPQNISVPEGNNVTLECVTRGFPPPRIVWTHNGRVLPYNQSALRIPNTVKSKHEGNYTCTSTNLAGSIRLGSIVRILCKQKLLKHFILCFYFNRYFLAFQQKHVFTFLDVVVNDISDITL